MASDASGKKIRKPYTITKSRESWTEEEHDKFLEALQLFDRDWKKIEDFVGSKTVIQLCFYFAMVLTEESGMTDTGRTTCHDFSSIGSSNRSLSSCEFTKQGNQTSIRHGLPDFAEVYTFIGNVFDPHSKGHNQKLKEMDPINVETVLLLMRNLTVNLSSPDFEQHSLLRTDGQ